MRWQQRGPARPARSLACMHHCTQQRSVVAASIVRACRHADERARAVLALMPAVVCCALFAWPAGAHARMQVTQLERTFRMAGVGSTDERRLVRSMPRSGQRSACANASVILFSFSRDAQDKLPLHQAASTGNLERLQALLELGFDIESFSYVRALFLHACVLQQRAVLTWRCSAACACTCPCLMARCPPWLAHARSTAQRCTSLQAMAIMSAWSS
jgi:hypothetical protein